MNRLYYRRLQDWLTSAHRKPLIIRGVRQCGKTYLLQHFGTNEFLNFHYFNFEKEPELAKVFESNLDPHPIINQLKLPSEQTYRHYERPCHIR